MNSCLRIRDMVQWLGLCPSNAGSVGSIPGQGTKIPHVLWCSQKMKKKKKIRAQMLTYMLSCLFGARQTAWGGRNLQEAVMAMAEFTGRVGGQDHQPRARWLRW